MALGHPPHLGAEGARLLLGVRHLGLGQRRVGGTVVEQHRLGQPVGRPVVGDGRPVVLDVVAPRRHVVADPVGQLAPPASGSRRWSWANAQYVSPVK